MKQLVGLAGVGVLLAACANAPAAVSQHEDFLDKAGFTPIPRSTAMFAADKGKLPPHRFAHHTVDGVTTYYYFDPTVCGCIYRGTAQNWANYKDLVRDQMHMDAQAYLEFDDTPMDTGGG